VRKDKDVSPKHYRDRLFGESQLVNDNTGKKGKRRITGNGTLEAYISVERQREKGLVSPEVKAAYVANGDISQERGVVENVSDSR